MYPHQLRFVKFIQERENSRINYEAFGKKGICDDELIRHYRFCNVNREHDAVTKWVREKVRVPLHDADINLALFNLAICRVINEPDTLKNFMPCLGDWVKTLRMLSWYCKEATAQDIKVLRGAYLIVSHGDAGKGIPSWLYYAGAFMDIGMSDFSGARSMHELAAMLSAIMGFSDFLSNQVLTDLRYMACTEGFPDRDSFVLCGPGTRRGINRWHKQPLNASVRPAVGTGFILNLREDTEFLSHFDDEIIHHFRDPNNLSNCFCEWDKHERARGEIALGKKPSLRKI